MSWPFLDTIQILLRIVFSGTEKLRITKKVKLIHTNLPISFINKWSVAKDVNKPYRLNSEWNRYVLAHLCITNFGGNLFNEVNTVGKY